MSLFNRQDTTASTSESFRVPRPSAVDAEVREGAELEPGSGGERVIPLVEEQLVVGKRTVETGTVRLHKHTEEWTETARAPLTQVTWQVEHVPLNRVIEDEPMIRQEGETTVYPVVEERLVVRRELVLVEEVRVTRAASTVQHESTHRLKREHITEERDGLSAGHAEAPLPRSAGEGDAMPASPVDSELPGFLDLRSRRRS